MTCENCKYDDLTFYDSPCNICCCNPSMSGTFGSRMNFFTPIRKRDCSNGAEGVKMEIDVHFDPPRSTAQEKQYAVRNGRVIVYETAKAKAAKQLLRLVLAPYTPRNPLTGAVALYVTWRFPYKGKAHFDGEYKTTRPDTDNLDKALKDVMTDLGYWKDDALIAREHIEKIWHKEHPGLYVQIMDISEAMASSPKGQERW